MLDSVRVRLTLWYTAVVAIVLILLAVLTYFLYARNIAQRTDSNLVELADSFATTFNAELTDETGPDAPQKAARAAMVEHRFRDVLFVFQDSQGISLLSSLDLPSAVTPNEHLTSGLFASRDFQTIASLTGSARPFRTIHGGRGAFRAYARPLSAAGRTFILIVLQSLHPQRELLGDIRNSFLGIIPIALLLAAFGGYFLARKSLAPVALMASKARTIGAANLHDRLGVSNPRDELGQLAISFNELLDRLEASFERQRRFIADASHELRTPVAILRGESEVTLSRADRSPAEYREALTILRDESQRLAHIVEDLFTLTRADAGQYPIAPREFYLDELASDVLRHARSLALAKEITLSPSIEPELLFHGDESLIRRLLLNLLDNAIKYTPQGGNVTLECKKQSAQYVINVTDSGPGIPLDLQPRIFERFFRADKARSRSETDGGGAGLGLSIARWIAEAHHGHLELARADPSGSTFTVSLPVSQQ
jgi:two-component system, OmpR family, sensor kinase